MDKVRIGIIVCSDRASAGVYEDRGGPVVREYLKDRIETPWEEVFAVIPDNKQKIQDTLIEMCEKKCAFVVTTGGTGPAPTDCTPEATVAVCDRLMPGYGEAMRMTTFPKVPTAILSRATAGIRGTTFILNLPGSPKAIPECLDPVLPSIPHAIRISGGPALALKPAKNGDSHKHAKDAGNCCGPDHSH